MKKIILFTILALLSCNKKVATVESSYEAYKRPVVEVAEPKPVEAKIEPPAPITFDTVTIYFPFGSALLQETEMYKLNLKGPVDLIGTACPIGSDIDNYNLGLARANTIKEVLKAKRIQVNSCRSIGESNPKYTDRNEYWKNRTCVIISIR